VRDLLYGPLQGKGGLDLKEVAQPRNRDDYFSSKLKDSMIDLMINDDQQKKLIKPVQVIEQAISEEMELITEQEA
jgi:hypothetical protein